MSKTGDIKKILVTGGTGFIGSHAVVELIQAGYEVAILDNLSNSKVGVLDGIEKITKKRPKFIKLDLLEKGRLEQVIGDGGYDCVMHFAGLKAVAESVKEPLKYYENNVAGGINLLNAMKKAEIKNIVFSSSATVYGDAGVRQYAEDLPTGQKISNPYGRTKYVIEQILMDEAAADPEFNATILRYFNPIGAHDSGLLGEEPQDVPNNLLPYIMKVATGELSDLKVFGDDYDTPDGTAVRDYIHVVDLAKGHLATLNNMDGVKIYNLGSGKGSSVLEVIKAFSEAWGSEIPYEMAGRRAGDLPEYYADASKALRELIWKTEKSLLDACKDIVNYLRR